MGKRIEQGALSRSGEPATRAAPTLPREGRFTLRHDRASPLEWELALEAEGQLVAWRVARGLPPRPEEGRAATRVDAASQPPARDASVWDQGKYQFVGAGTGESLTVLLEGAKLRGQYALRLEHGDLWIVERLDAETLRPMPERVLPMLATLGEYPVDEARYAFEPKWDGIRAIASITSDGRARIRSRNTLDITVQYPELETLGEALAGRACVLDGEIVALDEKGMPSFQRLQGRLGLTAVGLARKRSEELPILYVVFDILHLDGHDTTRLPYEERRALLEALDIWGPHAQLSPTRTGHGRDLLATPGLEGVVAKQLGSTYEPGARSRAWIKIKVQRRQELVIAGWTRGKGSRGGRIGALLVGVYDRGKLYYAGSVGTGFTDRFLKDLQERLEPLRVATCPFVDDPGKKDAVYVEPKLVCEVEFMEWTRDKRLRHPSFKGLREDKDPREVVREDA